MIFPPAFLDASNWSNNHGQQQDHHPSSISPSVLGGGAGGDGGGCGSHEIHDLLQASAEPGTLAAGGGGAPGAAAAKPMSMTERARMARIPQPEAGLKCPRCESTNTKFCYFNNYSLSQPRHFCRACRRYWTRGGALRNVPVGGGYRRHARRAKPKATPASASSTAPALASASTSTCTTGILATLPAMLSNSASILPPYLHRIADFDAMSLGSSLPGAGRPFTDTAVGCYSIGGGSAGLELMQSFPFLLAMNQTAPPAPAMAVPGMFHLGLDDSTAGGGGGGDGGGKLDLMPMRREGYPRERMYGDPSSGYDSYSSTAGN